MRITGPGDFALERSYALAVKPATQVLTRRTVKPIAQGREPDAVERYVRRSGTGHRQRGAFGRLSTALDAAALLTALDRYPFGCSEQITSRALPLLYVNELASAAHLALDDAVDQRIRDADRPAAGTAGLERLFRSVVGVGGDDAWLDAYVTDFLTRARERSFTVPDVAFKLALDRLRNFVATAPDPSEGRRPQSRLCALCAGAQRRRADRRPALSRRHQARRSCDADRQGADRRGARLLGDRTRAERVYTAALADDQAADQPELFSRIDYGSTLRDAAALVTLASEGGALAADHHQTRFSGSRRRGRTRLTPRRRKTPGWCWPRAPRQGCQRLVAQRRGEAHKGALYRTMPAAELAQQPLQGDQHRSRRACRRWCRSPARR